MTLSLKIFSKMRDFYLFIVCVLKFLWPDLIYYLTSWYACSMQNNCSAGLPKTKDKQKRSSGCCLVVVSAFSPLKHYLNKLKKKKSQWKNKRYICFLCVPGAWHSCWGLLMPAAGSALHSNLATSAFQRFYSSKRASLYFLFVGRWRLMRWCG